MTINPKENQLEKIPGQRMIDFAVFAFGKDLNLGDIAPPNKAV
jgi:hypothetical protein